MSALLLVTLQLTLSLLTLLLLPCSYRVLVGPSHADRLQALEIITTLLICIIILLALLQGSAMMIDLGIALAAFGFIATLAIARYLSEGRMF